MIQEYAPEGYHVPTNADGTLVNYLGGPMLPEAK